MLEGVLFYTATGHDWPILDRVEKDTPFERAVYGIRAG